MRDGSGTRSDEEQFSRELEKLDQAISAGETETDCASGFDDARRVLRLIDRVRRRQRETAREHDGGSTRPVSLSAEYSAGSSAGDSAALPPAALPPAALPPAALPPTAGAQIGPYVVESVIDRGGMGIVLLVHDPALNRRVALKLMLAGPLANDAERERFWGEAEAAARLDHPSIVPVYDVGAHHGIPYFTMSYVQGESLAKRLARGPLPPTEAARILHDVAQAVHYAHTHGVVHRDLKPANVMLDSAGRPRLTDFGLAMRTDVTRGLTGTGQVLGTPGFIAPEQARGEVEAIGPSVDVYAIGSTLYAALTGRPPFHAVSVVKTLQQVVEQDPLSPRQLDPGIPKDLTTVCLKCLEKQPSARYDNAASVAADLDRFLHDLPVQARRPSPPVRLARWCRRKPIAATLITLLTVLAVAGPLVAINQTRLYRETQRARASESKTLYRSDMQLALRDWQDANLDRCKELLLRHRGGVGRPDHRDFVWYYLWRLLEESEQAPELYDDTNVETMGLSPSARWIALGGFDGEVTLIDRQGEFAARRWQAVPYRAYRLQFSPDSTRLAVVSIDNEITLWEVESARLMHRYQGSRACAFSGDGTRFAYRAGERSIVVVDERREPVCRVDEAHSDFVGDLAFTSDSESIISVGWDGTVRRWDADTGNPLGDVPSHVEGAWRVRCSSDGRYCATGDVEGHIQVWNLHDRRIEFRLEDHRDTIESLEFSPDNRFLASASSDNTVCVWSLDGGHLIRTIRGHLGGVTSVAFLPDSSVLLTSGREGQVRQWDLNAVDTAQVLSHPGPVNSIDFSQDMSRLATTGLDGQLRIWDTRTGRQIAQWQAHNQQGWHAKWIPGSDSNQLISLGDDGRLVLFRRADTIGSSENWRVENSWKAHQTNLDRVGFAFHRPTRRVAYPDSEHTLTIRTMPGGEVKARLQTGYCNSACFLDDGRYLAVAITGNVIVWDLDHQQQLASFVADEKHIFSMDYDPITRVLACGGYDRAIKLWSVTDRLRDGLHKHPIQMSGHRGIVSTIRFVADSGLIASGDESGQFRLWDPSDGAQLANFLGHKGDMIDLTVAGSGDLIASCSTDGTVRLWRASRASFDAQTPTEDDD